MSARRALQYSSSRLAFLFALSSIYTPLPGLDQLSNLFNFLLTVTLSRVRLYRSCIISKNTGVCQVPILVRDWTLPGDVIVLSLLRPLRYTRAKTGNGTLLDQPSFPSRYPYDGRIR